MDGEHQVHSMLGLHVVSKANQRREGPALCCQCLDDQIITSGSGPAAAIQLPKPYSGSVSPAAAAAPAGNQAPSLQGCKCQAQKTQIGISSLCSQTPVLNPLKDSLTEKCAICCHYRFAAMVPSKCKMPFVCSAHPAAQRGCRRGQCSSSSGTPWRVPEHVRGSVLPLSTARLQQPPLVSSPAPWLMTHCNRSF